ncbi:MAG TPA: patatin-like phospholipase family protein [Povalibacter sp.]|uniref:patatin-like phospholipase family protein n=1 Tax=Povalibacter sp. TaxID=1962978 RepID=UPI002C299BF7|nr:patatin-like phospholipase family protein [Povalibacter sp.]HMN45501.1 patatin-like phospholipase family protein [Povalibacter sp.]
MLRSSMLVVAGLLTSLCFSTAATSQGTAAHERPRVALVLAGGGAKGGAHVGVLKVLEEQRVPIDCIAGTSMGALIGGGYASGIPAAEIEKFLIDVDWKKVVGSQGRRQFEPIEQKRAGATYSNDFEFGLTGEGLQAPGGLIDTNNVEDLLRVYVAQARLETDFDRLPIPYRAVATDMVSSRMIVLREGDLATAMRASMAIPGAFAPVLMNGMVLSDGGLVRNIPIDVARELCGDVVIVVNLVEPAADPKKLHSAVQLLSRTMDVMIIANEELQLQSLRDSDIRIDVEMGSIGTADFERVPETVPLGEAAARKMSAALSRFALPEQEYLAWRTAVTASQHFEVKLADVRFEGLKHVNPEYLAEVSALKPGDTVDAASISHEAQQLAVLQDLDTVGYRLDGDRDAPTLTWLPREKDWGPNYLKVDMGAYASAEGDLMFSIYGRHTRTWLNKLGAEWRNQVQIGSESLFSTSFFQPLDLAHRFFVEPQLFYSRSLEDIFRDQERVARYQFQNATGLLDLGVNIGPYAQGRVGYVYTRRNVDVDIGSQVMPEGEPIDAGLKVSAVYDSRDNAFSPTRGLAATIEYLQSDESMGGEREWERIEAGLGVAVPFRRDVLWVTLAGGSDLSGNLPPDRAFALGGPGSFPGFELGELRGDSYWTLSTNYLWKVKDVMPIRNLALYAGLGLTGGAMYDRIDEGETGEMYGGSLFLTGRTQIGPLTLGVASTSMDSWSVWLSVGRPLGHGTILERGIFR